MTSKVPTSLAISDRGLLTEGDPPAGDFEPAWNDWLDRLVNAGVEALQIREKDLEDGPLLDLVRHTVQRLARHPSRPKILVNGRLDIALAAGADGVHFTSQSLPIAAARRHVESLMGSLRSQRFLIGCSTHRIDEVQRADDEGADYVVFGPLFPTPGKTVQAELPGLDGLQRVSRLGIPILALGGITQPHHVARAMRAGAHGVAAIRGFLEAPSRLVSAMEAELAKTVRERPPASPPDGDAR